MGESELEAVTDDAEELDGPACGASGACRFAGCRAKRRWASRLRAATYLCNVSIAASNDSDDITDEAEELSGGGYGGGGGGSNI